MKREKARASSIGDRVGGHHFAVQSTEAGAEAAAGGVQRGGGAGGLQAPGVAAVLWQLMGSPVVCNNVVIQI